MILFLIFCNSIVLALFDYSDRDSLGKYNQILNYVSAGFALAFLIEAVVKIIAMGFIGHQYAYLRDPWNVLDFLIVVTGTIELVAYLSTIELVGINLKSLRNLRVLRPLRSVNAIPGMRRLVGTLIDSLIGLLNVAIFVLLLFILFGILGLQLFSGSLYNACRLDPTPNESNYWQKAD